MALSLNRTQPLTPERKLENESDRLKALAAFCRDAGLGFPDRYTLSNGVFFDQLMAVLNEMARNVSALVYRVDPLD